MAAKQMFYTEEGFKALKDELDYLKGARRQEVKDALATARSYGDLSENSEYDEAKNEQAKVESRIAELEQIIAHAVVINESEIAADVISVGSAVRVEDKTKKKEYEYTIVGSNEANPFLGKISDQSPIGEALIGAKPGDTVTVAAPNGERKLTILEVARAKNN